MLIPAVLDIESFCEENKPADAQAAQRMNSYVDNIFTSNAENKSVIQAGICAIKSKINEKLQERNLNAYEAIIPMVELKEYETLAGYDHELSCFQTAVKIYRLERADKEPKIFDIIEDVDDFQIVFQQMIFYFRRMQLHLDKPLQEECMTYIRDKGLSVYAVLQILLNSCIGDMEEIAMTLAELYAENHMYKEALLLLLFMAEQGDASYKQILTQKSEEYLEKLNGC